MDPPIRAVVWDFGGVLVRTVDPAPRRTWESRLGLAPGDLERLVFRSEIADKAALGRATETEVWDWVCRQVGVRDAEREAFRDGFYGGDRLDEDLLGFVREIRTRCRTGLLSNAFLTLRPALTDRFPMVDAFDIIVISAEEGVAKPDRRIYETALLRLGVAAEEAVFVDDFEANCEGARAAGLHAVRFESPGQAREAVTSLLSNRGDL